MQNPFNNMNGQNDNDPNNLFNQLPVPPNYAKVQNQNGEIRIAKVGISWTTFLFGPLPAAFRGDWYNFFLMLVWDAIYVITARLFSLSWMLSFPWPSVIFTFFYNMMYFRHLLGGRGFLASDSRSEQLLARAKYLPRNYQRRYSDDDNDDNNNNNFFL